MHQGRLVEIRLLCILGFVLPISANGCGLESEGLGFQTQAIETVDTNEDDVVDSILITADDIADLPLVPGCENPFLDANDDGIAEALDLNCDAEGDLIISGAGCIPALIDGDLDRIYEGIDLDCDDAVDFIFNGDPCLPIVMDRDGNRDFDGLDLNCDAVMDHSFGPTCRATLVPGESEGDFAGVDLDCDGEIDFVLSDNEDDCDGSHQWGCDGDDVVES